MPTAATKKKSPTKRVAKSTSKTKAKAPGTMKDVGDGIDIILPGQEGFQRIRKVGGREDIVTPVLDPILVQMVESGNSEIQIKPKGNGGQFSVNQVRTWATRTEYVPKGMRLSISGGWKDEGETHPRNIGIKIVKDNRTKGE